MDRATLIRRRAELLEEINLHNPLRMATDLGPASNEEYKAYLVKYERMKEDLASLNQQLGLAENSTETLNG